MSNRNRDAGHSFERTVIKRFKAIGFSNVGSSRFHNRKRDHEKVDLANADELKHGRFPYNVQCKTTASSLNYPKLLEELPLVPGIVNVVVHRRTRKIGKIFRVTGLYAFLYMEDYLNMVEELENYKRLLNEQISSD